MKVYLLPHHPLDPRFRYTLERETPSDMEQAAIPSASTPLFRRALHRLRQLYRKLKFDYDQVVHGHEQIRLSRLVLMMDRDPDLTLVVPSGMSRECALEAVRGVIRSGLMALRSHAVRNIITAVVMMVVLFGATPTHVAAVIFYPLIGLYAWGRYWEDRLIRRRMKHLLEIGLVANGRERFREEFHLAQLEEKFHEIPRAEVAYREAVAYLDKEHQKQNGQASPRHDLMYAYYSGIERFDHYERYQDRIRKKLGETVRLVARHLWDFWNSSFRWSISMSRILGLRIPNLLFVLLGTLALGYAAIWYFNWRSSHSSALPRSVRALVDFSRGARLTIEAELPALDYRGEEDVAADNPPPTIGQIFYLTCPVDYSHINLWPVLSEMIHRHVKYSTGTLTCPGPDDGAMHEATYEIRILY